MDHSQHSMHASHDVSKMGMDHSAHAGHMGHSMHDDMHMNNTQTGGMMAMYFFFSKSATVLFEPWTFSTTSGLIGSMFGIIVMAALYEGLKYFREFLFWQTYNKLQYNAVTIGNDKANSNEEEPQIVKPTMFSRMHLFQTLLHMLQMIISYFLMLIFMTYNTWLCIAVVIGAGIGYFLFGWKKSVVVDVTEHCH